MVSIINWQTGTPTEFGLYLVVLEDGNKIQSFGTQYYVPKSYQEYFPQMKEGWVHVNMMTIADTLHVVAWYKITDIKISTRKELSDDEVRDLTDSYPRKRVLSTQLKIVWTDGFTTGYKAAIEKCEK